MPNTFDEASSATVDMFEEAEQANLDNAPEETPADVENAPTVEETPAGDNNTAALDDAAQVAETAAQLASEKDAQLQQVMQELEVLKQQNQQLQGTIDEISQQNQQNIVEEVLEPPVLDVNALAFADEETVKAAQAKYAEEMAAYNRQSFMKEFAPVIEQANEAKYTKEKNEVLSALAQVPELNGINDMVPQLDKIIANNRALSSADIPIDEKYITAYAIAKGVNSINTPPVEQKPLSTEELMALYNENPEFQEMVEKQRIAQVKQHQQVPPFSASSGAVNAALNIKEEPKGWDDASERTRQLFGMG